MIKTSLFILFVVLAAGLHIQEEQHDMPAPYLSPGKVTILSNWGNYMARCNGCGPSVGTFYDTAAFALTSPTGPWAYWNIEVYGNKVAFKADTGKYLARCVNCWSAASYTDSAFIYSKTPTGDALWTVEPTNITNRFMFRSATTGKYLSVCRTSCVSGQSRDYAFVDGAITTSQTWFTITYIFPTSGKINLLSDVGTYLSRCNNCGSGFFPDSASLHITDPNNAAAIWTVEAVGNKVAFKADNGKYLTRCTNCWSNRFPPDSAFVHVGSTSDPATLWTPIFLWEDGRWAFRSDLGRHLAVCTNCVANGAFPNFAFAHVDSPSEGPWAHWTLKVR